MISYQNRYSFYSLLNHRSAFVVLACALVTANLSVVKAVEKAPAAEEKPSQKTEDKPKIEEGEPAPAFSVLDMNGKKLELSQFAGKKNVLLTFFPKCFTGRCTNHLSSLRDVYEEMQANDTEVIAVSVDPADGPRGQKAFAAMWNFEFPMVPDVSRDLCILYGAATTPNQLAERMSVLIDKKGVVRWITHEVNVQTHGEDVLAKMSELGMLTDHASNK